MWAAICTTVLLDMGILAWVFFHDNVCETMISGAPANADIRKLRTLQPLCVQTSDIDLVIQSIHIFNAIFVCAIAAFITVLARRAI
jgi:hypothetical protein